MVDNRKLHNTQPFELAEKREELAKGRVNAVDRTEIAARLHCTEAKCPDIRTPELVQASSFAASLRATRSSLSKRASALSTLCIVCSRYALRVHV